MFSFFKKNTQTSAPKSSDTTAEKTTVQVVKSTVKTTQVPPANKPAKKPTVAKTLTPAQKKEQDELNKCISDFSTIMRNERIGDLTVDCTRENLLNTDKIFTLVIFATKCYFSTNILEGLKKYVPNGIPVVFALDRTIKKNKEVYSKIKELEAYENVASFYFSRGMTAKDRLQHVLPRISSKFVGIFTLRDKINVRSFQQVIENQLNANADADIFSFNGGFNLASTKNASVSGLSGLFFNKNFLEKSLNAIQNNADYWLGFYLLNQSKNANVKCVEDKEKYWLSVNTDDYSVPDLSFFMRDSIDVLKNLCKDTDSINLFVDYVIEYLQNSVAYKKCSDNKIALVASGCAILCSSIKKYYSTEEWRKIIYRFCVIFDFDQITKKAFIQNIHKKAVTSIISVKKDVVAVLETDFMQDLKESLLPALEKKYTVIYESKPQYYDYHFFYCMVMRTEIQPAQYVISSNDMHKYITSGKQVIILWHGLGMLKEVAEADRVKYPMNYMVNSAKSCVEPYAKSFHMPVDKVLPLGQVQTDILFDKAYLSSCRKSICELYSIPHDAQIVFFAPTFRNGTPNKYYDFGVDIELLSKALADNNIYIITKKHHVFSHIMRDKGIDTSGVKNSQNGHFIVDEQHTFVELICASDKFITDYSSGLFYAFIRDLPIVLYAPDVKSYQEGPNGFMINYPSDIPVPFVGEPDASLLMDAILNSDDSVNTPSYKKFKEIHVGSCDGNVSKKLLDYFATWDGKKFADLTI
ncbi:CDP-glycerol glycerophosphotransferase family protein [uncultured Ruminobacter sp.]|uniref:CDP-glycerol glycerophosphotransferase family protein n=1 Tax=uncultured Ruminobacter sp. TaxID=538947 RepID=UPI00262BDE82|nr:CDP-glycerol glycerophosphotransferase family protein [uncultured Ruminobacter sp.]